MPDIAEQIYGVPNISGHEEILRQGPAAVAGKLYQPNFDVDFGKVRTARPLRHRNSRSTIGWRRAAWSGVWHQWCQNKEITNED